jgi:Mg-dependent DNase
VIDSHCHLDLLAQKKELRVALESAKAAGLTRIRAPSITPESGQGLQALNERYESLLSIDTALGLHPYFLTGSELEKPEQTLKKSRRQLEEATANWHPPVKAGGETGIDGHISGP